MLVTAGVISQLVCYVFHCASASESGHCLYFVRSVSSGEKQLSWVMPRFVSRLGFRSSLLLIFVITPLTKTAVIVMNKVDLQEQWFQKLKACLAPADKILTGR